MVCWAVVGVVLTVSYTTKAAPTFIVPLATNQVVPAALNSAGVGLGILDFQGSSIGYAVTVSNLSGILAADIRVVSLLFQLILQGSLSAVKGPYCFRLHDKQI